MKSVLTMFPLAENVHLTKDVGMVPFILHKYFGYDATLACYKNGIYSNLDTETPGLKLLFIPKVTGVPTIDGAIFLLKNARRFDVLICFHFTYFTGINFFLFKLLNGFNLKKITYVKLDATEEIFEIRKKKVLSWLFKCADVKSTEITFIYNTLIKSFKDLLYIPNGFYPKQAEYSLNKKNIFLTVGRIGSFQKATEILLKAFVKIADDLEDWTLLLIGPIEKDFENIKNAFLLNHPSLVHRIVFTGSIDDRKELMDRYIESKIFILPSRYESFGIVFLEAGIAGCTIVSSDILPAKDVTDNEKYGKIFPVDNVNALADILFELANNEIYLKNNSKEIKKYYEENFYWPKIIEKLDRKFKILFNN